MPAEFTAVVERDGEWYVAHSPEIPGANGQGRTPSECLTSLGEAIEMIVESSDDARPMAEQASTRIGEVRAAPSTLSVRPMPEAGAWLRDHAEEYVGRWVALRGGELLCVADSLADLRDRIGSLDGLFVARVT